MTKTSLQACQYKHLSYIRHWQIHTDSNHFCFHGRCITGKNLSGAMITISLISLTSILWLMVELPILMKEFNRSNLIILIMGLLLIFYTYLYFFLSMCTDPGIIPRPSFLERSILNQEFNLTSDELNNLVFDIEVNDILVKCKYCITCHMIRPPRASHCAICSNCIAIRDHHCPFLSTCIGMRNYRFFLFFLICLLQTELFFFATSLMKILFEMKNRTFSETIIPFIPLYFILIITSSSALYTCNLLGYHCMISSRGLTTREDDKGIYIHDNPFNTQPWYWNLARKLCSSLPLSVYEYTREKNQENI